MQFTIVSLFALALGVSASVIGDTPSRVGRDLPTITTVINSVGDKINALDAAASSYDGGDATAFQKAGTDLETAISDGVTTVQGTSDLTLNDAIGLQSQVTTLQSSAEKLVADLAGKKAQIEGAGLCDTVRGQSTRLNDLSKQLIDAITAKVPTAAQSIASQLTAGFTATLQQNQANFADGNCTNAGGGSGGGASSASSSSSASASTTSAPAAATGSLSSSSSKTTSAAGLTTSRPTTTGGGGGAASVRPTASGSRTMTTTGGAGGASPTSSGVVTVNGGAALQVGSLGGLALGFAAMLL